MELQLQYYFKYLNYDLCRCVNSSVNPIVFTWEIQFWTGFWHIGIISQNQYPHHLDWTPSSRPKATKLTKLYRNNSWQINLLKQFLKAGISECAPSIPTVQKKQLSSVPRKCPCYKWYVFNILIYITCSEHNYSVCRLIATVPWKKKVGTHGE